MFTDAAGSAVRRFITTHFSQARTRSLADEEPLLESGIVDSLGILDLVAFIESEFKVRVDDDDLTPENFNSISRIVAFIEEKQKSAGVSAGA
jgi:acyl carrier protein